MPHRVHPTRRPAIAAVAVGLLLVGLAGCGSSDSDGGTTTSTAKATTPAAKRTAYPVTIEDCDGTKTTYDKAPERIVTIDPSITEMLITLGLADKIVGYTEFFAPAQQWPQTKAAMAELKMINDGANYPSQEAIVAANPDFVASVYSYAFADPLPTRAGWRAKGIDTYQALGECSAKPVTDFSLMYRDMRNLGKIFDVQGKAEAAISAIEKKVAAAQAKAKAAELPADRLATQSGGTEVPDYYGSSTNAVIELAGSTYIWGDLGPTGTSSWEQFVQRDPTAVWVMPDAGTPVADLEKQLTDDPRIAKVSAIRDEAFVVVPQADATVESPRLADGLTKLVDALIELHQ